jgi:L-lysine 6-transaminase
MVRARRVLEVVEAQHLIDRATVAGAQLMTLLRGLAERFEMVTEVRGRGLMCAFSLPSKEIRDAVLTSLREDEHVLLLGCGTRSIRFRPALTVSEDDLAAGVAALHRVLERLPSA